MEDLSAENRMLKKRLQEYRRAAAVMLSDWWAMPAEGFKERLEWKHRKILRKLIRADLSELYGLTQLGKQGSTFKRKKN